MKYLILGLISETGQQLQGPDLEAWMQEIGAWYEKYGSTGKLADSGYQLDSVDKVKTVRAGGVIDGPFMETKEVSAAIRCSKPIPSTKRWRSPGPGPGSTGGGS